MGEGWNGGASDIVKAQSSGEDPRATGGLDSSGKYTRWIMISCWSLKWFSSVPNYYFCYNFRAFQNSNMEANFEFIVILRFKIVISKISKLLLYVWNHYLIHFKITILSFQNYFIDCDQITFCATDKLLFDNKWSLQSLFVKHPNHFSNFIESLS